MSLGDLVTDLVINESLRLSNLHRYLTIKIINQVGSQRGASNSIADWLKCSIRKLTNLFKTPRVR